MLIGCFSWDDWVQTDRLRKLTEENLEIARNLKAQADAKLRANDPKSAVKKKPKADSDFSSNRGSEDRQFTGTTSGRGQKRGRGDVEIEKVGLFCSNISYRGFLHVEASLHFFTRVALTSWLDRANVISFSSSPENKSLSLRILLLYFE